MAGVEALPSAHFEGRWLVCRCRRKLGYDIVAASAESRAYCRSCRRWMHIPSCVPGDDLTSRAHTL